ncbi:ATP-dependent Clp protease proteolytic subunit [Botrimarina hoheduenensis]|uniref:ATP-dependent Clp protease proteolytic subunit n=1 Tax=Botrimarina hoheduenensis TaxID=2528000 RepID=UPI0018D3941C|nr:ATP-dependent Clp protease proteolytic subunit [Botrimarina hoheduenensis]
MTLTLVVGFVGVNAGRLLMRVIEAIDVAGGPEYLAEPLVDQLFDRFNESGYGAPPLNTSDPLLADRMIIVTEGMNERVAARVIRELRYLAAANPDAPITLYLSTPGGWLDAAFAIVDTMRSISPRVNVVATGGCYSAGTVILAGATGRRSATPNTLLSVHVNDYLPEGNFSADDRELARFRAIYAEQTAIPQAWFDEPGDNHYYLDALQALELELIEAIDSVNLPAGVPADTDKNSRVPAA